MAKLPVVLVFIQGEYDSFRRYEEQAQADAFAAGATFGAGKFGGDDLSAFVLPGDESELREFATDCGTMLEVDKALAATGRTRELLNGGHDASR